MTASRYRDEKRGNNLAIFRNWYYITGDDLIKMTGYEVTKCEMTQYKRTQYEMT